MRSRGSNPYNNPQNLSAVSDARKDPNGKKGTAASAAAATIVAPNSTPIGVNVTSHTKPRKSKFALPGTAKSKPKHKRPLEFRQSLRRKQNSSNASSSSSSSTSIFPLILAVLLWYSLGVVSISSSKVLLTPYNNNNKERNDLDDAYLDDDGVYKEQEIFRHVGGLPPLFLTIQQLLLGSTFLRLAIHFRFLGLTKGFVPIDALTESLGGGNNHSSSSSNNSNGNSVLRYLVNTGIFFALGFLTTNMAFGAAAPTYVETLKAAEPITSAVFAVVWGIEYLTLLEIMGLMGIVGGCFAEHHRVQPLGQHARGGRIDAAGGHGHCHGVESVLFSTGSLPKTLSKGSSGTNRQSTTSSSRNKNNNKTILCDDDPGRSQSSVSNATDGCFVADCSHDDLERPGSLETRDKGGRDTLDARLFEPSQEIRSVVHWERPRLLELQPGLDVSVDTHQRRPSRGAELHTKDFCYRVHGTFVSNPHFVQERCRDRHFLCRLYGLYKSQGHEKQNEPPKSDREEHETRRPHWKRRFLRFQSFHNYG